MKPIRCGGWRLVPALSSLLAVVLTGALCLTVSPNAAASLTIIGHFDPSAPPPPNLVGGGNLEDIFNAAADTWERAFIDVSDPWTVDLTYSWADLGTGLGHFDLLDQGGSPHRVLSGRITFNNSDLAPFFADPTPLDNSEYSTYTNYSSDLGGGTINIGRVYSDPTGDAVDRFDLLQVAAHEIGHGLGLINDNTEWNNQIPGQTLTITSPRPHDGTEIFLFAGHIDQTHYLGPLMVSFGNLGERRLISALDILAEAQMSSFAHPNLNPDGVGAPEPSTAGLLFVPISLVIICLALRHRRGRNRAWRAVPFPC